MVRDARAEQPLRLLLVEDSRADAAPLLRELRRGGLRADVNVVTTREEYLASLRPDLDAIVSDIHLQQFGAPEALALMRERALELPFIVIARSIGEERDVRMLESGAADCLPKDHLALLPGAILQAIERRTLRRERASAEKALGTLQKQHALILNAIADGVLGLDRAGTIIAENPAGAKMLGWEPNALIGCSAHEILHEPQGVEEEHSAETCPLYTTLRSGQIRAARQETFRRSDGSAMPVEYISAPLQDEAGELLGALVTFRDISQRITAERELRQSELRFRELSDAMPQIVWAASADGTADYFNHQAVLYTAWAQEELIDSGWVHLLHPDDVERTRAAWRHAVESGSNYENEYRLRRASDGAYRWQLVRALPVRDANGAIVRWFGTCTDIDDQKKAQETLRRSEANLAIAQRVSRTGSWEMRLGGDATDGDLTIEWSNETFRIFGLQPRSEQITQERFFRFVPPADHAAMRAALAQMMNGSDAFAVEHRVILSDGRERIVHEQAQLVRREDGTPEKIIGTVQDITERRHAEDLLRQQAEMLNLAHDAIIVRDFETGKVVFWNTGAERLYGWTAAEVVGQPIGDLMPSAPKEEATALSALTSTGEFRGELRKFTNIGREVVVNARSTLVRDADGTPRSVLSIDTDVTEHKKLEQQLLRAQRLESIGTLASGVAHDLNNILAPILMSAPLLREDLGGEATEKIIQTIEESAQRGAQIVRQVLTFARGVEGERVLIAPSHLIKEMAQIAQQTFPKSIRISARFTDDLWPVEGDATQLHQVLLNLSVNARDAMPNGGTLVLSAENCVVDEHYAGMVPGAKPGPHVLLRASDTGSGIPRAIIDNIFDPFFTTKEVGKGTGLGLSTVLGIVQSHGGWVSVHSEPGSGTAFKIFLPAITAGRAELQDDDETQPMKGNGETVLVVDDEPTILTVTKLLLENHNYRVLTALDGPEALAVFARHMDEVEVVITDMMMPYIDGVALIRALRRMSARVRFVASSGQGDQVRDSELHALGVTAWLAKPYDLKKLLATLHQLLGSPDVA